MTFSKRTKYTIPTRISSSSSQITYYVGPGSLEAGGYRFYDSSQRLIRPSRIIIQPNITYLFRRLNNATSHPFYISSGGVDQSSRPSVLQLSGQGTYQNGITGSQMVSFQLQDPNVSKIYYYCTTHPLRMQGSFRVSQ